MKNVCVECGKDLSASDVKTAFPVDVSGRIMKSIIWVKKILNVYKGNHLYVCKDDVISYTKKRNKFLKSQYLLILVFAFLAFIVIVLPIFSGSFSLDSIILLVVLFGILYLLILIRGYYPSLIGYPKKEDDNIKKSNTKVAAFMPRSVGKKPARRKIAKNVIKKRNVVKRIVRGKSKKKESKSVSKRVKSR